MKHVNALDVVHFPACYFAKIKKMITMEFDHTY